MAILRVANVGLAVTVSSLLADAPAIDIPLSNTGELGRLTFEGREQAPGYIATIFKNCQRREVSPKQAATSREPRKRDGSSIAVMNESAVPGPTPGDCHEASAQFDARHHF